MANYTKSFNFRHGVQVDDDNFIIDSNGLVGIGTTLPGKLLDVYGNARISGIASLVDVGVTGIITAGNIKIDASSGVVTATKFVGDASGLINIVAIATGGWISQTGTLSTTAKIGINSTIPSSNLDVDGHIKITGFSTFGNNIDANGDLDVDGHTELDNLKVSGVSTFSDDITLATNKKLYVGTANTVSLWNNGAITRLIGEDNAVIYIDTPTSLSVGTGATSSALFKPATSVDLSYAGTKRFQTSGTGVTVTGTVYSDQLNITGVSTLGVTSATDLEVQQVNVSGVSTFVGISTFKDNVNIGNALSDRLYVGASIISNLIPDQSGSSKYDLGWSVGGSTFHWRNLYLTDTAVIGGLNNSGVSTFSGDIQIGTAGIISAFNTNVILKSASFNVKKNGSEEDLLIADADGNVKLFHDNALKFQTTGIGVSAYGELTVASLGGGTNNLSLKYGSLRYGNEGAGFPYSTRKSLDILNYDTGNINFNLDATNQGSNIGDFYWSKYNSPVMTLTSGGNLGIGITLPEYPLHVSGLSTFTGNATFGNNLEVDGTLTVNSGSVSANITGNITGNVTGAIFAENPTGVSTISELVSSHIGINGITIDAGNPGNDMLQVNQLLQTRFYVNGDGKVGICTDKAWDNHALALPDRSAIIGGVGIGTTDPKSALDFSSAGASSNNPDANLANRFMILPQVSNTAKSGLTGLVAGALIWNTTDNRMEYYNGSAWRQVDNSAV